MARVTVEDCVDKVANRFELILVASHRALVFVLKIVLQHIPLKSGHQIARL